MKNKVLLQLLRILNINDYLRFSQEKAFSSMLQVIETLSKCLKDCEYAFFNKTSKTLSLINKNVVADFWIAA
jgi:hypothetical protein